MKKVLITFSMFAVFAAFLALTPQKSEAAFNISVGFGYSSGGYNYPYSYAPSSGYNIYTGYYGNNYPYPRYNSGSAVQAYVSYSSPSYNGYGVPIRSPYGGYGSRSYDSY
ncbi:MAG: hypothetical protein V4665_01235 [Patescibacteria group bacterium]